MPERSASLSESWSVFWAVLFPNEGSMPDALSQWVKSDLTRILLGKPLMDLTEGELRANPWLDEIVVAVSQRGASVHIGQHDLGIAPWFSAALIEINDRWFGECGTTPAPEMAATNSHTKKPEISRWKRDVVGSAPRPRHQEYFNAIEKLLAASTRDTERWREECRKLLRYVTRAVGRDIQDELLFKVRIGHLMADALFVSEKRNVSNEEVVNLLNRGMSANLAEERFQSANLIDRLEHVRIQRGPGTNEKIKMPTTFDPYDLAILERMKDLISSGREPNITSAAATMAGIALKKGNQIESVQRRLQDGYSSRYSDPWK